MRKPMRKVTLAFAMLPLLASAPVLAASVSSQQGQIQLAQAGNPGGDQFAQQVCNLAHQNAQSYARILQLRDKMLKIQRDNETRFQALEKGRGGAQNHVSIGSTAILDDAMRDNGAGGQGGYQQSPGLQQEVIRNLTGKVEDVDAQISFTNEQLQKTQDDNQFRFEELEKKKGGSTPAQASAGQDAPVTPPPGSDLCAQGMPNPTAIADTLGARAEAMNFQVLELQDQMQKMQEENERRFQALENGGRADAVGAPTDGNNGTSLADAAPAGNPDNGVSGGASSDGNFGSSSQTAANNPSGADSTAIGSGTAPQGGPQRGEPPQSLGSIRFDNNGNVIGETINAQPRPVEHGAALPAGQAVASLPTDDNPNSLYQAAYQYLMSGDYKAAETGFREHIKRYPADPTTAEARYWLGESLYGQSRFPEAATVFIDTQRDYPDSKRAPENMFKLGMTLEKMDNHDVACATFKQIPDRYPNAAPAVLKRVTDERTRIKC
ncbi:MULTISPECIES: tol-pal system protein YbgF [Brucella]|uniref:Cell division coordinator CpoB n=2 Tax=Brucella pseudogrignonensis TaxID=419475 RepID=A0A7Y3T6F0_9HYPH|nr:tol-pal system protein YbgF [Brucella pseudogrignonensis]EMG53781.1 Tol-Pal system protein YbgF [Ochrobactrum sp. CDB2]NNV21894.1 tol-pal system protein YbgF [Brucella pseudogrignonensis]